MAKKDTKLSSLHWFVYSLLVDNERTSENPISQYEVWSICKNAGFDVTWNENQNQHNDHCRWLNQIVTELNNSTEVDKIIAHHAYKYYVCNREEANALVTMLEKKIALSNERKWSLKKKIRRDLQGKLLSNSMSPRQIDAKSKAKHFYETFFHKEESK